ncbi:MAG TPA: hypothetical protein VKX25_17085 [Bryobacteraceae bacterium]|nr:hypothetical protein [Bryobacteraceae bacterium]
MSDSCKGETKILYLLLGITVPLAIWALWPRLGQRKREIDKAHDITVEDSFPASDPPSAW